MISLVAIDMDGTISDLYGVPNFKERLIAEDRTIYDDVKPLIDMKKFNAYVGDLIRYGVKVPIVTYGFMSDNNYSKEYQDDFTKAKLRWLEKYEVPTDMFVTCNFGSDKYDVILKNPTHLCGSILLSQPYSDAILIDDDSTALELWSKHPNTITFDSTKNDVNNVLFYLSDYIDRCAMLHREYSGDYDC